MVTVALWLLLAIPAGAGTSLVLAGPARLQLLDRAAGFVAVGVAGLELVCAIVVAACRPTVSVAFLPGLPAILTVDGLSAIMTVTVASVTVLVLIYAAAELDAAEARARFFGLMLVFSAAMQLTVTAGSVPVLLAGWEVMGAVSFALIGFWWREEHRVASATTAFLTTRAGDLGLYIAAGAALAGTGGGDLSRLAGASPGWRNVIAAGVLLAAAGKSAQLPFSFWLSRAMDGPSPVSALLHSATMVAAGGYLALRTAPLLAATGWAGPATAWLGAITAVALGLVALAQRDLKQLLAASTCAQVGFMLLAAGSGAVAGGTIHLVAHAATKALLFCAAGAWLTALGTKDLSALRGAARRWPGVGVPFVLAAVGLAGVPPLAMWASKDAALAAADLPLYAVGLVGAALSAAYSARALALLTAPLPADPAYDTEQAGSRRVNAGMVAPLLVLAVFAVGLVVVGLPPIYQQVRDAVGGTGEPGVSAVGLAVSAAIAVGVSAGVAVIVRREIHLPVPTVLATGSMSWWGLERGAHIVAVAPTLRLARGLATVDDQAIDGGIQTIAAGALVCARLAVRLGETSVDDVIATIATGARRLGALARRPQTGLLHQYYAQAAVALAAAVIVLLVVR